MNNITFTAKIATDDHITVWPEAVGANVDRPQMSGYAVKNMAIAKRLVAAIEAGAVFYNPKVLTDVNGKTFLSASSRVLGRMMNADLNRLGF